MTTARHEYAFSLERLSNGTDTVLMADGTLWSHAATLGMRTKGSAFNIDRAAVENFVRLYKTLPGARKLCIDYEHGTVNGATSMGQPVPKAGDVYELAGVFAESDFTGALRIAAEKLAKQAGRPLSDPRNFGLWTRWKPTARALGYIQAGEITEMSIAFDMDLASNVDGSQHGPGLLSIALTNLPFLDDMLPVAASKTPNTPAPRGDTMTTPNTNARVLALVGALAGTAVSSEDEAVAALTAHTPEHTRLRTFARDVSDAIGETDPTKALAKVKTLTSENTRLTTEAAAAKKTAIATQVEAFLVKHEKKLTVPLKKMMANALSKELEDGAKTIAETETAKTIESLPDTGITSQASLGDPGKSGSDDEKLLSRVRELLKTEEIKELSRTDGHNAAYNRACELAEQEFEQAASKSA